MRNLQSVCYIFAVVLFWQPFADNLVSAGIRHYWREMTSFDIEFEEVQDCSAYEPIVGVYPINGIATHRVIFYQRGDIGMHTRIKTRHKYQFLIVRSKLSENEHRVVFFKINDQLSESSANLTIYTNNQAYEDVEYAKVACQQILADMTVTTRSGWSLVQDRLNLKWAQIAITETIFEKVGLVVILHFLFMLIPVLACIPFQHILIFGGLALNATFGTAFTIQSIRRGMQRKEAKGGVNRTNKTVQGVNFNKIRENVSDKEESLYERIMKLNGGTFLAKQVRNIKRKFKR